MNNLLANAVVVLTVGVAALLLFIHWKRQRDQRPLPVSRLTRMKSGGLVAAGFASYMVLLALIALSTPIVGTLMYAALFFASPSAWGWSMLAGPDTPWPVGNAYLPIFLAAPLPIVGFIVGYALPLPAGTRKALGGIGVRFALSLVALGALGPLLFIVRLP